MKSSIKFLLASALVVSSLSVNAQGIQLSYVNQTTVSSINNVDVNGSLDGIQCGLTYDSEIFEPLSLNYGLSYTYLFGNSTSSLGTSNTTAHQLDVPLRLVFTVPLPGNLKVFGFGGPDFSYALSNKTKTTILGITGTSDLYDENSDISQFNLQAGVGAGLSYNNVIIKVGYDWGLIDLNKSDMVVMKTNALTATVGVSF